MGNLTRTCLLLLVVAVLRGNAAAAIKPTTKPTTSQPTTKLSTAAATTIRATAALNKTQVPHSISKVVGGVAVPIKDFPYQLSLRVNRAHICGATIISIDWAVTSAHCATADVTEMTLLAGSANRASGGTVYKVSQKIIYTTKRSTNYDYDIALLKVANPFVIVPGLVEKIALPVQDADIPAYTNVVVSGWGTTSASSSTYPNQLMAVNVTTVPSFVCELIYGYLELTVTPRMICAGSLFGGYDTCQGDTGGPMVATVDNVKQLVGITSWRFNCSLPLIPSVYTNVGALRSWIQEKTTV